MIQAARRQPRQKVLCCTVVSWVAPIQKEAPCQSGRGGISWKYHHRMTTRSRRIFGGYSSANFAQTPPPLSILEAARAGQSAWRHDPTRWNELIEVAVVLLPQLLCMSARRAAEVAAFYLTALLLCSLDGGVPWPIIGQWSLDRELFSIFVDDDEE